MCVCGDKDRKLDFSEQYFCVYGVNVCVLVGFMYVNVFVFVFLVVRLCFCVFVS